MLSLIYAVKPAWLGVLNRQAGKIVSSWQTAKKIIIGECDMQVKLNVSEVKEMTATKEQAKQVLEQFKNANFELKINKINVDKKGKVYLAFGILVDGNDVSQYRTFYLKNTDKQEPKPQIATTDLSDLL